MLKYIYFKWFQFSPKKWLCSSDTCLLLGMTTHYSWKALSTGRWYSNSKWSKFPSFSKSTLRLCKSQTIICITTGKRPMSLYIWRAPVVIFDRKICFQIMKIIKIKTGRSFLKTSTKLAKGFTIKSAVLRKIRKIFSYFSWKVSL